MHHSPIFDSFAYMAVRAESVLNDGSIDGLLGIKSAGDESFLTIDGAFVYFFWDDVDDSTWLGAGSRYWNVVLGDGTLSKDGCQPSQPAMPPLPPIGPSPPLAPNETHSPPTPVQPPAPPIAPPPPSPPVSPPMPLTPPPTMTIGLE